MARLKGIRERIHQPLHESLPTKRAEDATNLAARLTTFELAQPLAMSVDLQDGRFCLSLLCAELNMNTGERRWLRKFVVSSHGSHSEAIAAYKQIRLDAPLVLAKAGDPFVQGPAGDQVETARRRRALATASPDPICDKCGAPAVLLCPMQETTSVVWVPLCQPCADQWPREPHAARRFPFVALPPPTRTATDSGSDPFHV